MKTLFEIIIKRGLVAVCSHEIESFIEYCNARNVHPSGGCYAIGADGKVYGQYFYI